MKSKYYIGYRQIVRICKYFNPQLIYENHRIVCSHPDAEPNTYCSSANCIARKQLAETVTIL